MLEQMHALAPPTTVPNSFRSKATISTAGGNNVSNGCSIAGQTRLSFACGDPETGSLPSDGIGLSDCEII